LVRFLNEHGKEEHDGGEGDGEISSASSTSHHPPSHNIYFFDLLY
jgi:hypothetical protein